jgi:ubiquinone/menaquinone biosynthesis C-methylase UbiE
MADNDDIVPALGHKSLTWAYDLVIALMTREATWRRLLVAAIAPRPDDTILDFGCGSGSLAILLKGQCPQARVIGLDPDPEVLRIAHHKAEEVGLAIELVEGDVRRIADIVRNGEPNKIVSSLVFHHLSLANKRSALGAIFDVLRSDGGLYIADYGLQRTWLMRRLFRLVQHLDGFETTQPNADGVLPQLMAEVGFDGIAETSVVATPTGSISLYQAHRAPTAPKDAITTAAAAPRAR